MRSQHRLSFESLEGRRLLSAALVDQIVAVPQLTLEPAASGSTSSSVAGYSPQQIQHAYGFDQISLANGIKGDGSGQTIAIVDAYNDPKIASDLHTFDQQFGLSDPDLKVVSQTGSTSALPANNAGWSGEIALDVEWAHAMAPGANILLVEAKSATLNDLLIAVDYARNADGVSVVSMSWGINEFSLETSFDSDFTTPAGHQGVTFIASAGDEGSWSGASWPSVAPGVLSVGGTTLYTSDSSGTYVGETGWTGSGGGISSFESEPSYQSTIQGTGARTAPDVSFNANPNTGFAVYDSVPFQGVSGWQVAGGTSAGAPQWAALVAIADQGRTLIGVGTLDSATGTLPALYSTYSSAGTYTSNIHDVRLGRSSFFVAARPGYDLVTGLGSPQASGIVQVLVGDGTRSANVSSKVVIASSAGGTRAQPLATQQGSVVSPPPAPPSSPFSGARIVAPVNQVLSEPTQQTRAISRANAGQSTATLRTVLSNTNGGSAPLGATPRRPMSGVFSTRGSENGVTPMHPYYHLATQSLDEQNSELAQLPAATADAATLGALADPTDPSQAWKQWGTVIAAGVVVGAWAAQRNRKVATDVRNALARHFRS
jgi:hypothetical protein